MEKIVGSPQATNHPENGSRRKKKSTEQGEYWFGHVKMAIEEFAQPNTQEYEYAHFQRHAGILDELAAVTGKPSHRHVRL